MNMSMSINRELPLDKLVTLLSRVDSIRKAQVAELWILGNNVISESKRLALLGRLSLIKAKLYVALAKDAEKPIPKFDHKLHIDGVRELKVG